jgi:cytochrome c-type protein NapB
VGIAATVTLTVVGFLSGLRGSAKEQKPLAERAPVAAETQGPVPRSYGDQRARRPAPNGSIYDGAIEALAGDRPDLRAPVVQTEAERRAVLDKRASRRAYDGAPPTIPHRIDQMAVPDCVSCHENGAKLAGIVAPKISHPLYQSCTQCHVVARDPRPVARTPEAPANDWAGIATWGKGTRAHPTAPPTIPHPTAMRGDCSSCHGVTGPNGIRSTHPWRQSCTQCHAPDARLDQGPVHGATSQLGPGGALP